MKKINLFSASLLLGAAACFSGCDGDAVPPEVIVPDAATLTQNVFADQTQGANGVSFTTTGAWTSSISETVSAQKAAVTDSLAPAWISVTPDHGDEAGDYTVAVTLKPNTTGKDRSAAIAIRWEGSEITISVMQKGTKEDGNVPEDDDDGDGDIAYGGQGWLKYVLNDGSEQLLPVDGATQKFRNNGDIGQISVTFYNGHTPVQPTLDFFAAAASDGLPAGRYDGRNPASSLPFSNHTLLVLDSITLEGAPFYYKPEGSSVTVSIEGDTYTVSLDINLFNDRASQNAKITGAYTGYISGRGNVD
ncbi:MAG: BACON domain-containing protein [Bacteroidales bacterium]|nr:BACON domain-containing protein [Bacteroidales bacterium]